MGIMDMRMRVLNGLNELILHVFLLSEIFNKTIKTRNWVNIESEIRVKLVLIIFSIFVLVYIPAESWAEEVNLEQFSISIPYEARNEDKLTGFEPPLAILENEQSILLKNDDLVIHRLQGKIIDSEFNALSDIIFDSGNIKPNSTYEISLEKGYYVYSCTIHPWRNGLILVGHDNEFKIYSSEIENQNKIIEDYSGYKIFYNGTYYATLNSYMKINSNVTDFETFQKNLVDDSLDHLKEKINHNDSFVSFPISNNIMNEIWAKNDNKIDLQKAYPEVRKGNYENFKNWVINEGWKQNEQLKELVPFGEMPDHMKDTSILQEDEKKLLEVWNKRKDLQVAFKGVDNGYFADLKKWAFKHGWNEEPQLLDYRPPNKVPKYFKPVLKSIWDKNPNLQELFPEVKDAEFDKMKGWALYRGWNEHSELSNLTPDDQMPAVLKEKILKVWSNFEDLQESYPEVKTGNFYHIDNWIKKEGWNKDYRFADFIPSLKVPEYLKKDILDIWKERKDLQKSYPEVRYGDFSKLDTWVINTGWKDDPRLGVLIPEGQFPTFLESKLKQIWNERVSLQELFPEVVEGDLKNLKRWAISEGWKEDHRLSPLIPNYEQINHESTDTFPISDETIVEIWNENAVLQKVYPEARTGDYKNIKEWMVIEGWKSDLRLYKLIPEGKTTNYMKEILEPLWHNNVSIRYNFPEVSDNDFSGMTTWAINDGWREVSALSGFSSENSVPDYLEPVLLKIWNEGPNLQKVFPEVRSGDFSRLKDWALLIGWNEDPRLSVLIPEGKFPYYLTKSEILTISDEVFTEIWNERVSLQELFPEVVEGDLKNLKRWAISEGWKEDHRLSPLIPNYEQINHESTDTFPISDETIVEIWNENAVLQKVYPEARTGDYKNIKEWALKEGWKHERKLKLLVPYGELPNYFEELLIEIWIERIDIHKAFPEVERGELSNIKKWAFSNGWKEIPKLSILIPPNEIPNYEHIESSSLIQAGLEINDESNNSNQSLDFGKSIMKPSDSEEYNENKLKDILSKFSEIVNNVIVLSWQERSDLQKSYPEVEQGNLENLKRWAIHSGWKEDPRLSVIIPDGKVPNYLDAKILKVWEERKDLQSIFPEVVDGELTNIKEWALESGWKEDRRLHPIIPSYLKNALLEIWNENTYLQKSYPEVEQGNLENLRQWATDSGWKEDPRLYSFIPSYLKNALLEIWNENTYLQKSYPEISENEFNGIMNWANEYGWKEDPRLSVIIPDGKVPNYLDAKILKVWEERKDLQENFPEVADGELNHIKAWASDSGWKEEEKLLEIIPNGEVPLFMNEKLLEIWNENTYLQKSYPEVEQGNLENLKRWATEIGWRDEPSLSMFIPDGNIPRHLNNVLINIWEERSDLQNAFPQIVEGNLENLRQWAINSGWREDPRLSLLIPTGQFPSYLNIVIIQIWEEREDLQENFPEVEKGDLSNLQKWAIADGWKDEHRLSIIRP